ERAEEAYRAGTWGTRRPRVLAAGGTAEPRDRRACGPAGAVGVPSDESLPYTLTKGVRAMNAMTARGLSLGVVVAVWTAISHFGMIQLIMWPVIVGLGSFVARDVSIFGFR